MCATLGVGAAPTGTAEAVVPELSWHPCPGAHQRNFECANARGVPLDYGVPGGETIKLAVIRRRATDRSRRIGTLFFNPGGPGGAGTQTLPMWYQRFPAAVRARFDIVSWDPRGVGRSTAVQCFAGSAAENKFFSHVPEGFPVGRAQRRAWIRGYARFGRRCRQRNGSLLEHVSTRESAEDLNLLRRAVGGRRLNYLGVSYGTLLGATYANLFPRSIRAMVLDGNVDPVAWVKRGRLSTSMRQGSDKASAATLRGFLKLCGLASTSACAFSAGSAPATRLKWAQLMRRVRRAPITEPRHLTYAQLASDMVNLLYAPQRVPGLQGWADTAQLLQRLWVSEGAALARASSFSARGGKRYSGPEQTLAIECSESPNPRSAAAFRRLAREAFERARDIGRAWLWGDEPCASWPAVAVDRYAGPWNRRTSSPVLVIGNTSDPATPYQNALAMSRYLARARLLTVEGYGHTALLNPSACASAYVSDYLVRGSLPPPETVCRQDRLPFAGG